MSEMPFNLLDINVPTDNTQLEGMHVVFADRNDDYPAFYYPDIEYVKYGDRSLRLNLIKPAYPKGPSPLIVYIQGSGWLPQERYEAIPQLSHYSHYGYAVASVEYRHSKEAHFPAHIQDVKTAIRFLRENAETYNIDAERIAVWGDSSGGHLASLVGVSDGYSEFENEHYKEQSSKVKAVIDFYGPTDFTHMNKYPSKINRQEPDCPEALLLGGPIAEKEELVAKANPINFITEEKDLPPFLIMHGDQDGIVPFNQSVLLYQALRDMKHDVTFYKVKGGGHGEGFWHPPIMKIVHEFLKSYL